MVSVRKENERDWAMQGAEINRKARKYNALLRKQGSGLVKDMGLTRKLIPFIGSNMPVAHLAYGKGKVRYRFVSSLPVTINLLMNKKFFKIEPLIGAIILVMGLSTGCT